MGFRVKPTIITQIDFPGLDLFSGHLDQSLASLRTSRLPSDGKRVGFFGVGLLQNPSSLKTASGTEVGALVVFAAPRATFHQQFVFDEFVQIKLAAQGQQVFFALIVLEPRPWLRPPQSGKTRSTSRVHMGDQASGSAGTPWERLASALCICSQTCPMPPRAARRSFARPPPSPPTGRACHRPLAAHPAPGVRDFRQTSRCPVQPTALRLCEGFRTSRRCAAENSLVMRGSVRESGACKLPIPP